MLSNTQKNNAIDIINVFNNYGIKNIYTIAAVLAVCMKETQLTPQSENLSYSAARLAEVWGVFSKTGKPVKKGLGKDNFNNKAIEYSNNPEKLGNFIYGNRFGNTDKTGFFYRGRGYNQLTFHDNYKTYQILIKENLLNNPDKVNEAETAAKVLFYYFFRNAQRFKIDLNNLTFENAYNVIYAFNAGKKPTTTGEELKNTDSTGGYITGKKFYPYFINFINEAPNVEIKKKINIGFILLILGVSLIIIKNKKLKI
jgi:predicted chitinase